MTSLACIFAACALHTSAQNPDTSARGLGRDLEILERTYRALHPGLLRYNSAKDLDRHFAELGRAWSKDQDLPAAYREISLFLAKIKCGHTYANFFNQTEAVSAAILETPNRVPFTFRWIGRKMVVTRDCSVEREFPAGTIVLSLDGVPTPTILKTLMRVARADGSNDAKRIADLEVGAGSRFEAFDVFFPLFHPVRGDAMTFDIRKPGDKTGKRVTARLVAARARMAQSAEAQDPAAPMWDLSYPAPNTALLRMPTWAMYKSKWNWRKFISESFDALVERAIGNLVIDLRGNEGGDSVGDAILARLATQKIASEDYQRYTRYRRVPDELRPHLSTWDKSFFDWGPQAKPDKDGFFRLIRFDDLLGNIVSPSPRPYLGHVYVIVGPENSSATFEFAYQMKRLKLGTLVGRPTGGNLRGINGGAFFFLELPNSKIEVDVPLIAQFYPTVRPDQGVEPDIFVEPTAQDIARGRDAEMQAILARVERQESAGAGDRNRTRDPLFTKQPLYR